MSAKSVLQLARETSQRAARQGRTMTWAERAKILAFAAEREAARAAADPTTPFRELFKLAIPSEVGATTRTEHHEMLRRCFVLRAWCAVRIARMTKERRTIFISSPYLRSEGWHREARRALEAAAGHRKLATDARGAER